MKLHRTPSPRSRRLRARPRAARAPADPASDLISALPLFEGFPYLVTSLVGPLHHLIALPGDLDLLDLKRVAWRQYRANRLRTCLVLASDAAVYLSDAGEVMGEAPRSTSPICNALLSCKDYKVSIELLAREERLRVFVEASRTLPAIEGYLVDHARGRRTTPEDIELLTGANAEGVPAGLVRCPRCGQWRGECLWPHEDDLVVRVYCHCENHNRCARCLEWLHVRRLDGCYYDESERRVIHVPTFCGLNHRCP